MRKNRYLIVMIFLAFMHLMSITIYAKQDDSSIKVNVKSNLIYALNGKKMLEEGSMIIYDNDVYVSIKDISKVLEIDIEIKDNTIDIKQENSLVNETQVPKVINLDKAVIVGLDTLEKKVTILPYREVNESLAYIVLNIQDETEIIYEAIDKAVPIAMLKKDMVISVVCTRMNVDEYRGEYLASQIIIREDNSKDKEEIQEIEDIQIIEINTDRGYIKAAYIGTDKNDIKNQVIIHIDSNTNIKDKNEIEHYIKDLYIGQKIKIITNGIMTSSIPPQTLGLVIILLV